MKSHDSYDIGLGNHDDSIRRDAAQDYEALWNSQAKSIHWFKPWTHTLEWSNNHARWFVDGITNMSYNALDIHQSDLGAKPAIIWEGEDGSTRTITYAEMLRMTESVAAGLESLEVKKGDRVTIYMPMIPETVITMLACSRIGAVHTVVFSGFSAKSLAERINDSGSQILVAANMGYRRGNRIDLAQTISDAINETPDLNHVIVLKRDNGTIPFEYTSWADLIQSQSRPAEPMKSTDPLFILYTSGTTGKPKGILHGTGGYMVHIHSTFRWAFDIRNSDVYFCTADVGWVTGHSYVAYGPLLHGATQVMYEGAPDYPDTERLWRMIQKHRVTILYTTPTALRMLIKYGPQAPRSYDLSSLRLLGSVGEPINPDVWRWYYDTVGSSRCPVIDTWWQTETGGMLISALPGIETIPLKPGSGTLPIPGLKVAVLDEDGNEVARNVRGYLAIKNPWPGIMLGIWGDDRRYQSTYWSRFPGWYYPGDYAIMDPDGYLWLLGRADDVLKVAGHRIGTAELESCMVSQKGVAEAAVVGIPDPIKGENIVAFVVMQNIASDDDVARRLRRAVSDQIGSIAKPKTIHVVSALPKTRSGKIMRRLLRGLVTGEQIGDITTMEDPTVLEDIQKTVGK